MERVKKQGSPVESEEGLFTKKTAPAEEKAECLWIALFWGL